MGDEPAAHTVATARSVRARRTSKRRGGRNTVSRPPRRAGNETMRSGRRVHDGALAHDARVCLDERVSDCQRTRSRRSNPESRVHLVASGGARGRWWPAGRPVLPPPGAACGPGRYARAPPTLRRLGLGLVALHIVCSSPLASPCFADPVKAHSCCATCNRESAAYPRVRLARCRGCRGFSAFTDTDTVPSNRCSVGVQSHAVII